MYAVKPAVILTAIGLFVRATVWLVLTFFPFLSFADEMRPSLLKLSELENQRWSVSFKQPQIRGRFVNLKVKTNCVAGEITPVLGVATRQEKFVLNCAPDELSIVEIVGLEKTLVDTMVTIRDISGQETNHLLSSSKPVMVVGKSSPAVPIYIVLGIEHLIFGIDHVLFVLVLLYVVRGLKNLLKVITSFTVAHSITLGLSSLNMLSLAQPPVEALISLSIVFLAAEALRGEKGYLTRAPWVVSALFGLLHGMGFAGALAEIGLPEDTAIIALLFFNIGIEVGQMVVVIAALALVAILDRTLLVRNFRWFSYDITKTPLYCAGAIAGYWFIERVLVILV